MDKRTLIDSWAQNTAESQPCTPAQMQARIARWGDIPASPRAFVDTWIDGHQRTLYSVIGSGVTDDRTSSRASRRPRTSTSTTSSPPRAARAYAWHDTEEVFVVQAGRWEVDWIDAPPAGAHRDAGAARHDQRAALRAPRLS